MCYGMPSPLSVALYLRALFARNKALGFGDPQRFLLGLRSVGTDRGFFSSRPLLTYQDSNDVTAPSPLFDEHRCSLDVTIVVDTTGDPFVGLSAEEGSHTLEGLRRAATFTRFLGGDPVQVDAQRITSVEHVPRVLRGTLLYSDETQRVFAHARPEQHGLDVLRAVLLANLDKDMQNAASERWEISPDLWQTVNGPGLRIMPLAYRRLSPFIPRPDARFVLSADGTPKPSVHAFVESAHGVVALVGAKKAFHRRQCVWWTPVAADTLDFPVVFSVQGEPHHE
jgi:hypothetical protein